MRLAIFGATGPTGRLLVDKALAAGHDLAVYARDPGKVTATSPRLRVVQGSLTDTAAIARVVQGRDAVISLLGPKGKSPGLPISAGTANIVAAMKRHGVRRIVATATPSAADPNDRFSLPFALAVSAVRLMLRSAYDDIVATAGVIRGSGLDWTLARLPHARRCEAGCRTARGLCRRPEGSAVLSVPQCPCRFPAG